MHLISKVIKKIFILSILLVLFILLSVAAYRFDNYTMYSWEARIRWGNVPFESGKFREVSTNEKAKMMADLLRKKYFIGEVQQKVKEALGDRTGGYYHDEVHLTYTIFKSGQTTWDVVFIFDYETKKIGRVILYRQRDGITRTILYGLYWFIDRLF